MGADLPSADRKSSGTIRIDLRAHLDDLIVIFVLQQDVRIAKLYTFTRPKTAISVYDIKSESKRH